jgi:hypothetical protein
LNGIERDSEMSDKKEVLIKCKILIEYFERE